MNESTVASSFAPDPTVAASPSNPTTRCLYRYPNHRRCSLPGLVTHAGFCLRHSSSSVSAPLLPTPSDSEDLSADLLHEISELSSAEQVYTFLTRLLTLVTKGRISPRRASVLGYITNQPLNSQRTIIFEEKHKTGRIIIDMPGPDRSDPESQPAPRTWQEMRT